ncbi:MAG: phytoene/squalene synthase family protein [Verrucomicrobiales bacterium]|nr:phytoene/squalene synthase family protein [Verrucomicrobiales bacterium]
MFPHDDLLRSVSRSFYLSMRFLPPAMREPVSLGYLLARLTDTIADAPGVPLEDRLEALEAIRKAIQNRSSELTSVFPDLPADHPHAGERALLEMSGRLFPWLQSLDAGNRSHVEEVILTIIHGQKWDLSAFPGGKVTACETGDDLLRYTYWVAGCVGEFWTKVGFTNLGTRFADPDKASSLLVKGRKLGQALQLINILRDLHEDLPAGRCYLPGDELREAGWDGESRPTEIEIHRAFGQWLATCESYLEYTPDYVGPIRDFRTRFCTRLPMILASRTASALREAGVERVLQEKIKIPRSEVWKSMAQAVFC